LDNRNYEFMTWDEKNESNKVVKFIPEQNHVILLSEISSLLEEVISEMRNSKLYSSSSLLNPDKFNDFIPTTNCQNQIFVLSNCKAIQPGAGNQLQSGLRLRLPAMSRFRIP